MDFSFHARTFPSREEATAAFYNINAQMQEQIPNAFLTMSEVDTGEFAVLLGCHDIDAHFVDSVEPAWAYGEPIDIDMDAWMALEASHSRHIAAHARRHPGEDLNIVQENVHLAHDGREDVE